MIKSRNKSKNILTSTAISSVGPKALHFTHGKDNSDIYLNILEDSLRSIEIL
jgi:hypothetical protein